ncbi:gliding motility-associated C-terminal domain-containing protein [Mucilaginibacter sp. ZT4R22]|uniref:Gliding motility-associated C-terminal domain-containing protein n=1 Tax=Mucilaginibacter pankratovii TaxID=2772110 RepID=A0ABR7WNI6_9SPHI|nr:gliding motility-associated C-terminal domain-containing protein [Mucilaginibacter pankratovii]MBD1362867.1 gliding motility-associated C-terminal domain-containing protein [Mucilaginibacter pankratovii]
MNNLTLSAILLPKLSYRRAKAIILALAISCTAFSASTAKPIPVANGRHATAFASTISSFAPASGAPGTLVTVTGTGFTSASTLIIGGKPAIVTSFTSTQIVGMVMPGASTGKVTVNTGADVNSATNFTVTPTPFPTQQLGGKLADTTTYPNAYQLQYAESHGGLPLPATSYRYKNVKQGNNVVVSADGNTAVAASLVGLNYETQQAYAIPGGLTFYEKHDGAWVKTGYYFLNFSIGPAPFGKALALNANGTVLFVTHSADYDPYNAPISVFEKQNGVWKPTTFQGNGQSVAVSADGNTAVTGYGALRYVRGGVITTEYTTVYHRINGNWAKDPTLPGDGSFNLTGIPDSVKTIDFGENQKAGGNVALSADGKTLAATSYLSGTFIMKLNGTQWVKEELLTGATGLISLSADGNVLISTNAGYLGNTAPGYSKLFTRAGSTWSSAQIIQEAGTESITADGNIILFSGNSGPVIYIRNNAGVWVKQNKALSAGSATSVAISADGTTAFSGNVDDNSVGQVKTKIYTSNTVYENGQYITTTDTSYRTDPYGSLTAYSVAPPMSIASVSPTTGPVGTLVKVTGTSLEGATLSIGGKDAIVVSNTGTVITGMVMPGTVTGVVSITNGTTVAGGNFTVTPTPYPKQQQGPIMADLNTYNGSRPVGQGSSLALSADGNTAMVGSLNGLNGVNRGGLTFYERNNGTWAQSGQYYATAAEDVQLGGNISINADGTVAISASNWRGGNAPENLVYAFEKQNGVWKKTAELGRGFSASVSADGNTIAVGYGVSRATPIQGVTIYHRINGIWVKDPEVPNSPVPATIDFGAGISAGAIVTMSADGKTIAAASLFGHGTYIVTYNGTKWVVQANIPQIENRMSLTADGNLLLMGGNIYARKGTAWSLAQTMPEHTDGSISADGNSIILSRNTGPVVYTRNGAGTWVKRNVILSDKFAPEVAISADGTTAFSSNSTDFTFGLQGGPNVGSVTAYTTGEPTTVASVSPTTGPVGTIIKLSGTGLLGTGVKIGGVDAVIVNNTGTTMSALVMPGTITGAVTITDGNIAAGNFTVTPTLYPNIRQSPAMADTSKYISHNPGRQPLSLRRAQQGYSVAISADGNSAVAGVGVGEIQNFVNGGVIFYERQNGAWQQSGGVFSTGSQNGNFGPRGYESTMNADGTVAIVTGQGATGVNSGNFAGVYYKVNGIWTEGAGIGGGQTAALSADGNTAVIGDYHTGKGTKGGVPQIRTLNVYNRIGSNWVQGSDIPFSAGTTATAAISADGKVIAGSTPVGSNQYTSVFVKTDAEWVLATDLPNIAGDKLALSGDGALLLISNSITGASVYGRNGNTWALKQQLPQNGRGSINIDGSVIMFAEATGTVVYTRAGSANWVKQTTSFDPSAGFAIAVSADGTTAFMGNPRDSSKVPNQNVMIADAYYPNVGDLTKLQALGAVTAFVAGTPVNAPSGYANTLTFTNTTTTGTTLSWTKGNGGLRAVFIGVKGTAAPLPADFTTYNANAAYGSGKPLGTAGWYCVYNGDGSSVNITNLLAGTTYRAEVIEYNGNNGNERYLTTRFAPADVTTLKAPGTVQASAVTFAGTTGTTTTVNWVNGNGTGRAVFINKTNSGAPLPADVYYSGNSKFTGGNQIGSSGWYCIYNGTGSTANVTLLTSGQTYRVAVVEYSGTIAAPKYLTTGITPANVSTPIEAPSGYSTALTFSNTTATSSTLSWTNGNGAARIVFIKKGTSGGFTPVDGVGYAPNNPYTQGFALSDGWYCVYRGTGNSVNLLGLSPVSTYRVAVIDYNGTGNTGGVAYGKRFNSQNVTTLAAPNVQATPPTGYAVSLAFSNTASTSTTLSWVNSNGAARAVFVRIGTSGALGVTQGTTYTANNTFAAGTQAGTSGWFCVYNGTGNNVNIVGLNPSTTYRATVIEYNGAPGLEGYNLSRYNGANVTTTVAPVLLLTTNQKRMLVEQDVIADDAVSELNVHQGVSPNGDGVNDVFTIDGIGAYPENTVKVINNSGDVIYSVTGYNNYGKSFDGHAANGTLQKAGTYFYSLEYKKGTEVIHKTGYLVIKY